MSNINSKDNSVQDNIMGANNAEIAKSMMTNTLINSMKTGIPIIDVITSLVVVSNFKNQMLKNVFIIIILMFGVIIHRITKSYDILNNIYELYSSYYNPSMFINYIPSKYIRDILTKYNGYELSYKVENNQYYIDLKNQYSLLALLNKVNEKYPTIEKKIMESNEILGYNSSPVDSNVLNRLKLQLNFLDYSDFEKSQNSDNSSIKLKLLNTVTNPPRPNKWYLIDDIKFRWNIVRPVEKVSIGANNTPAVKSTQGSFHFVISVRSCTKNEKKLMKYIDDERKDIIMKLEKYEKDIEEKRQQRLENISNRDFRGELYEIYENVKKTDEKIENNLKNYERKLLNNFCRPLETIIFKEKNQLLSIIKNFRERKGIYEKLPHRHKIGIMIYGKPGSGKTSLAVAIATELKRNIVKVSLKDKDLDDEKLSYILNTYKKGYVTILDELDTHEAFRPRIKNGGQNCSEDNNSYNSFVSTSMEESDQNSSDKDDDPFSLCDGKILNEIKRRKFNLLKKPSSLTLGSFLEAMDGVSSTEDRVVIAMTNHPKHLDPAIIRPGRFDIVINMSSLDPEHLTEYFKYLFNNFEHITDDDIHNTCKYAYENEISTSMLEQACIEKYSAGNSKQLLDCVMDTHKSFIF